MRFSRLLSFIVIASAVVPVLSAQAASQPLPRYSSVSDAIATSFTTTFRNVHSTEYVTCALPAPVTCTSATNVAPNLTGGIDGYRNEVGTLQISAVPNGAGAVRLTAYTLDKKTWKEKATWDLVGGVTRVYVARDGLHFAAQTTAGELVSYVVDQKKPLATISLTPTGSAITYSSTGKYLAWYSAASLSAASGKRCYTLADMMTGKTIQACDPVSYWDLVPEDYRIFAFSLDDTTLVYRSDRDGWQKPYRVSLAKGMPASLMGESLILKPYQIADMVFVDNDRLAVTANRTAPTAWGLWSLSLKTGGITLVADRASYGVALKRFGSYVSFGRTDKTGVRATLWNTQSGSVTAIDTLGRTTIPAGMSLPDPISRVASVGGGGYALWEPARLTGTMPIVIYLHGGPYRQIATYGYHPFSSYGTFDWMLEQVRQSGAVVAKLDYPGSYGYGRSYAESLTGNVGKTDVAAVANLITTLKKKYGASAPVYLVGNSYGGYLADKVLVEYPKSVAGIYSISGVSGWEELIASNPNTIFNAPFRNAPYGQGDALFAQAEVLLKADKIGTQKVLLAHGDADSSVSVSQTKTFDQILRIAGKAVSTTIYPGEDHVFTQKGTLTDVCKKMIGLVGGATSEKCEL